MGFRHRLPHIETHQTAGRFASAAKSSVCVLFENRTKTELATPADISSIDMNAFGGSKARGDQKKRPRRYQKRNARMSTPTITIVNFDGADLDAVKA